MNNPARKLPSGNGVDTQVPREEIRKGLTAFQVMQAEPTEGDRGNDDEYDA